MKVKIHSPPVQNTFSGSRCTRGEVLVGPRAFTAWEDWDNSFFFSSSSVNPFSYSGRSVARQQLLATSRRLDSSAPLGAGCSCAPGLLLAKSGSGGLNNKSGSFFFAPSNN
jgi:hypothetical protein